MRSIERALASQRFAAILPADTIFPSRILLTDQHAQQRIVPELVMVVEVFISQRQSVNPWAIKWLTECSIASESR